MSMDQLAQPNQKKPWHGITPGARFAAGGAVDDDVAGAIPDDGPHPPISGDDQVGQQPQGGIPAGAIPDMGAAPDIAQQGAGEGISQTGSAIARDIGQGVENLKKTGPVQLASRAVGLMGGGGENPAGGNSQSIIQYLMGGPAGGGADQETAEKFARPDKHKGASDDDANLIAVQKAFEMGGPQAAWAMVQFNRGAYNAKSAFALAAITGQMGKAPDINAAADAATKASAHMLDGSAVHYRPSLSGGDNGQPGVIATVKIPGTSQEQEFALTTQQFAQAVDPMGEGQYDKVIEQGGMPAHLTRIAQDKAPQQRIGNAAKADADFQAAHPAHNPYKSPHAQSMDAFPGNDMQFAGNTREDNKVDADRRKKGLYAGDQPAIPGTHDAQGHYLGPKPDDDPENYGEELQRRSRGVFPGYNLANEGARHQWMNEQEEKELDRGNKVDVAAEKGKNDIEKARVTGVGKMGAADISGVHRENASNHRSDTQVQIEQSRSKDRNSKLAQAALLQAERLANDAKTADERNRAANFGRLLASGMLNSAEDVKKYADQAGVRLNPGWAAPQAPTPQATPPQGAPPRPSNVPAGARFYKGSWYTRGPNGESVPVQ